MARLLIVGSVAQDDVVHLHEPMREGMHIEGKGVGVRLGGGGPNTAIPLARAGHDVFVVAAVGRDAAGEGLISELSAAGVDTSLVRVLDDAATTRSIIMVDDAGERTIVNLARTAEPEPPARILEAPADLLYVRSRALDLGPLLTEKARSCTVVAHIPPLNFSSRPAQILLGSQSDLPTEYMIDPLKAGRDIAGGILEWVVLTRGQDGASAFCIDGSNVNCFADTVETIDSTGAGDSFAAGLIHGLASGLDVPAAMKMAVLWGTESVKYASSALPAEAVARLVAD
jgi:ribokinase